MPPWVRLVRESAVDQRRAPPCRSPQQVYEAFQDLAREEVEVVCVGILNGINRLVARAEVARVTVNFSVMMPRDIFRFAVAMNATSIVVAHNHPSGDLTPSEADIAVTQQIVAAGKLLEIDVIDHLIIGADGRFVSFAERGLIGSPQHEQQSPE